MWRSAPCSWGDRRRCRSLPRSGDDAGVTTAKRSPLEASRTPAPAPSAPAAPSRRRALRSGRGRVALGLGDRPRHGRRGLFGIIDRSAWEVWRDESPAGNKRPARRGCMWPGRASARDGKPLLEACTLESPTASQRGRVAVIHVPLRDLPSRRTNEWVKSSTTSIPDRATRPRSRATTRTCSPASAIRRAPTRTRPIRPNQFTRIPSALEPPVLSGGVGLLRTWKDADVGVGVLKPDAHLPSCGRLEPRGARSLRVLLRHRAA